MTASSAPEKYAVGLDIGSIHLHAALLGPEGDVRSSFSLPLKGRPEEALSQAFERLSEAAGGRPASVAATGMGRDVLRPLRGVGFENEITAAALSAGKLAPKARGVIEVGGHFSKWVLLDGRGGIQDYSINELCAAGSGAFLEQQAARLELSAEEMGALAAGAPAGASVAGRCSVFAKSDMIHLQQKGTPVDQIAYGLCLSLARNYLATVLKSRELARPLAFVGGCAANRGLVRAFQEVLQFAPQECFIPELHSAFGAVGAAISAASGEGGVFHLPDLAREVRRAVKRSRPAAASIAPLPRPPEREASREAFEPLSPGMEVFIGVDVGSVSTDFALLDKNFIVVEGVYLPTRGNPIAAMEEGLSILRERTGGNVRVLGVGVTGSGRHLAARFLGADSVKNEITAQLKSAVHFFPEVDTLFEIGGQDSKYISARNGAIADFSMNKICAAGTGSFLEEQAGRLGLNIIREFEEKALQGDCPADLGSRCTVFMDTELVHAQQRGVSVENIAAGLAVSIASNYLEKVVGHMPVGKCVVFQGGVASNRAVVSAFSAILGREVRVHPYNRLSGAIGAALLAGEKLRAEPFETAFVGFDACKDYALSSFECRHCSNVCQVNRMERGGKTAFFGDVCERYTSKAGPQLREGGVPDLTREREQLLAEGVAGIRPAGARSEPTALERLWARSGLPGGRNGDRAPEEGKPMGTIGIPRASLYFELFPLWAGMLRSLGYDVVLSDPSSPGLLAKGVRRIASEACLPVKLGFSHALDLCEKKVDAIFFPSVMDLPAPFGSPELCSTCPYTQSLPFMVRDSGDSRFLMPQVNMSVEVDGLPEGLESLSPRLGDPARLRAAYEAGKDAYLEFKQSLLRRGAEFMASDFEWAVVLIGKPYNIYDSFLNLNLVRHLARMGVAAVPYEFLSRVGSERLDESWDSLAWRFNRDYVKAARAVIADPRLYPVVVSNFGCGPDAFTVKHLEKIFDGKPALFLEFDEHRGEAGLVTRLEAFIDEVRGHRRKGGAAPRPPSRRRPGSETRRQRFYIPFFADHAHAFSGALRYAGHEAEVLPPPDEETRRKGERFSSGKECHPYSILAGDLLRLCEEMPADGSRGVFFFPGSSIPCLLTQYGPGHRLILDRIGEERIDVMTPSAANLRNLLGINGGIRLWRGLVAVDMLVKLSCELRPYEVKKGSVDAIHRQSCLEIERAVEGGDILAAVERCVERLASTRIDDEAWRSRERPLVGVAGDIFTRSNRFANQELFARLEEMGCEIWPSPFLVDIFDFGLKREFSTNLCRRNLSGLFQNGWLLMLKEMSEQRILRLFQQRFRNPDEPDYEKVLRIASPYVGERSSQLLLLNTAKMIDFAVKGADGIVNAMCFNCMVGSVSAAITARLRKDHGDMPMVNLVFGGTEGTSQMLRLEAFVHQVKGFAGRRKAVGV
jgi:predicted CoA-substrate-specific enzyme activase